MNFKLGDLVTRISHKHDIIFKIVGVEGNVVFLKGVDLRLYADSDISDLVKVTYSNETDKEIIDANIRDINLDRSQYFYLPGKILHIDGDEEYLERCMNFYKEMNIKANGLVLPEIEIADRIGELLSEYRPDIVVITGHDAYYERKPKMGGNNNYQNSANFIEAVKVSRKYEKSQDKLIVIAGACQSNYEDLIKAGANFASSPKRINIHALDPAIIASSLALSDRNKSIDVIKIIDKTKYGSDGVGGIITNGTMYVGYPR
ncbi:MAG: sporulation peptidase YabG [Mycoplasmatota bacterium]|nr:sporulation peptidase YabG [Mycoplasmatota bacterium]